MLEPEFSNCTQIAANVRSGSVSARSIAETLLAYTHSTHSTLNAFTNITAERALLEADRVDAMVSAGEDPGPLAGVPFAVKNLFDLNGEITVAGSKINRNDPAATQDATAVERLNRAGAICFGALNMGEYAYDFITNNPHDGATRNPHDTNRSAGGSSGGSGAAIAAGLVPLTLGTDTNGSIRVPSSFCGIWGLRPTYGTLSRGGSFAFVDSLDTIGPFARCPKDLALAYDAMSGSDPRDNACLDLPPSTLAKTIDEPINKIRVARLGGYFSTGGDAAVHQAVEQVAQALDIQQEIELPEPALARTAAYLITAAESGSRHLKRLRTQASDFDPVIRDRLFSGAITPAAWVDQAQRFRSWWRQQVASIFRQADVLIAPATPIRAPLFGDESFVLNGKSVPLRPNIGYYTQPVSLVGLPIVAAPIHWPGELPCAVQLIGAPNCEAKLLQVARHLEVAGVCSAPYIEPETTFAEF